MTKTVLDSEKDVKRSPDVRLRLRKIGFTLGIALPIGCVVALLRLVYWLDMYATPEQVVYWNLLGTRVVLGLLILGGAVVLGTVAVVWISWVTDDERS